MSSVQHHRHEIENSKVVVVSGVINPDVNGGIVPGPFQQFISLEFVPDYAILKFVSVYQSNVDLEAPTSSIIITTDLGYLDNNNLIQLSPIPYIVTATAGDFINMVNTNTNVHIKLPDFRNRLYTFNINGDTTFAYEIGLTFEFISYKKPFKIPEPGPVPELKHNTQIQFR